MVKTVRKQQDLEQEIETLATEKARQRRSSAIRIMKSIKMHPDLAMRLDEVSRERWQADIYPATIQDIVETALTDWFIKERIQYKKAS